MKKIYTLLPLLALTMLSSVAHADWLMLQNGDRISGEILSDNANMITIESDTLGQIQLDKSRIASIHEGPPPRIMARELRTGIPMSGITSGKPIVNAVADIDTDNSTEAIKTTKKSEIRQNGVYKWSGRIGAGGTVQDGNSRSKTFVADADVKARDKMNRFSLGGEANWAEDNGEKTDNDQQIYANYDRFLTEKWFTGLRQSLEKDEFEELDLRSQTGLFLGYQFYEQDDLNLQVKAGPDYIYEKFDNGDSESDIALGWALDYDQKFSEGKFQIFHKHELSTPFADTGAFLFESETGARVPIGKNLDASAQVDFDWDNDPIENVQEDDTTYAVKLGYGW